MTKPFTKLRFFCHIASAVVAICALLGGTAIAEELRIGGTGNALGTMRMLGKAFSKKYPDVKVIVRESVGSSGAIKAIPSGALDIGVSSRALTDQERNAGAVTEEYARTPTVLAVSTKLKVTGITRDQLADIYSGKLTEWPDGTLIRPVMRQPGDDNTKQIRELSPAIEKALKVAEKRSGLPFAVIDQEAAGMIESVPGAIGVTSLALIRSEGRALRPLKLDNIEPSEKSAVAGNYPLIKHFFFVTKPATSATVQEFIAFVKSPAGREILTQTGHWFP